jgi:AcrR family transcriptional regulator
MAKRQYRNTVQAEIATRTRERIIMAALALEPDHLIDQITLEMVAEHAQVTVQTILRHFGTKDGLVAAVGQVANEQTAAQRAEAPIGDIAGAVNNLTIHYEAVGDRVMRLLAQEARYPQLQTLLQAGRVLHRQWVERVFGPYLNQRSGDDEQRLLAQLVALCDVYTWKLLRRDSGLSQAQYEVALNELLTALLSWRR